LSIESARDRLGDVLAGVRDQLADIAAVQKKQAELKVDGQAAEGSVEVTVNARGQVVNAVIDKSYLDDHDFEDLGGHITEAAQAAAGEAGRRVAEMLAPINERHKNLPSFSDIVEGLPELSDVLPPELDLFGAGPRRQGNSSASPAGARYDDGDGEAEFPAVRR
jgi:DNA-binding protein YbaB